jgi:hypothetical protein
MTTAKTEKTIEIAYLTCVGREGRLTWKRKIVRASKLEATLAKLGEEGVREIRVAAEGARE